MAQASTTALATFARSLRPRARLLVRLQMGATAAADACEEAVWESFALQAPAHPIAQWPLRYWTALLSSPALAEASVTHLPTALQPLPATERVAWLLRHIAHLDETHAAGCLDISPTAYAQALRQAEALLLAAGYNAQKMQRLRGQWLGVLDDAASSTSIDARVTAKTAQQLTAQDVGVAVMTPSDADPAITQRSRRHWWPIAALLSCAILGAGVWWWIGRPAPPPPTPPVPVPASEAALTVLHPDYQEFGLPEAERRLAERLDRLSWWAVEQGVTVTIPDTAVNAAVLNPATVDLSMPAASAPERFEALPPRERELLASIAMNWSALDAAQRARVHTNATRWAGLDEIARNALLQTRRDWDNSPRAEREARRQRYALWRALPVSEQALLREADKHWAALPIEQQQASEARFIALDAAQREAWWLGPSLGRQFPMLAPLFEHAPPADRERLLGVLRGMSTADRDALAQRVAGTSAAQRERLRFELLR